MSASLPVDPTTPPKIQGDALEAELIHQTDELESVPDSRSEWHDAYNARPLDASGTLPIVSKLRLPRGTPIEIKTAQRTVSNGSGETRGRWYIKQKSHAHLYNSGGYYLIAVYTPADDAETTVLLESLLVPARTLNEYLRGRWHATDRREGTVAKLAWNHVLPPERVGERR
jgi:hypothetical protein